MSPRPFLPLPSHRIGRSVRRSVGRFPGRYVLILSAYGAPVGIPPYVTATRFKGQGDVPQ